MHVRVRVRAGRGSPVQVVSVDDLSHGLHQLRTGKSASRTPRTHAGAAFSRTFSLELILAAGFKMLDLVNQAPRCILS